ncbi:DinB family protein [Planctomyces sp. SH-PL62]|uniref:DinB family protein n=1 Tax=Planctomyces sp. SH-PL62 TaxID=1636152 RepID=UPI00078C199B|nr:DinB family protein [Planctomyces sp. SH-PL62]AMV38744.1 DinB superfamily protein [Planctomyces sp. SH-PL62]
MTTKDLIRSAYASSDMIMGSYLKGLSRADLLIRAVPGMNHIAWQLGHLVAGERMMVEMIRPGSSPALPEGFEETYSTKNTGEDDASKFLGPDEYLSLWKAQREATLAVIDSIPDEELDREEPGKFPPFAPTVGKLLHLAGTHPILHAGQFVAVRRSLGLPIAF